MLLYYGVQSEIRAALAQLDKAVSNRGYFDSWRSLMAGQMDRREALEAKAAQRGVAVTGDKRYDTWRDVIDEAVDRCEDMLIDRECSATSHLKGQRHCR